MQQLLALFFATLKAKDAIQEIATSLIFFISFTPFYLEISNLISYLPTGVYPFDK
jgi:hypothetical protein